jgi:hypothetical protein
MEFIKRQWEIFRDHTALQAIELSLQERQSMFMNEYPAFAEQCFYTSYRAGTGNLLADAAQMPVLATSSNQMITGRSKTCNLQIDPMSINIYNFTASGISDTLHVLLADGNINKGDDTLYTGIPMTASISLDLANGMSSAGGKYYVSVSSGEENLWKSMLFLQNTEYPGNQPLFVEGVFIYPNPLLLSKSQNGFLSFRLPSGDEPGSIDFSVYDVRMKHVFSGKKDTYSVLGRTMFQWNPAAENDEYFPASGVYIYHIKTKTNQYSGKFVIIRK